MVGVYSIEQSVRRTSAQRTSRTSVSTAHKMAFKAEWKTYQLRQSGHLHGYNANLGFSGILITSLLLCVQLPERRGYQVLLAVLYASGLRVRKPAACTPSATPVRSCFTAKAGSRAQFCCHLASCVVLRHGRASVSLLFRQAARTFARLPNSKGCLPASRDRGRGQSVLVAALTLFTRAGSRSTHPSGASDDGAPVSGNGEPVFTCQTGGVERGISGRLGTVEFRRP
jgi:hypothetical protein